MNYNVYQIDQDCFYYYGYKIYRNGDILTPKGNELKGFFYTYPGSHIKLKIDGQYKTINKAKLIYMLFSGQDTTITNKYYILFKDNDSTNTSYDNMYLGSRSEYAKLKGCDGKPKFSDKEASQIKSKYENSQISLRKLAQEYDCSLVTIQKILGKKTAKSY